MTTPRETVKHKPVMFVRRYAAIQYAEAHGFKYVTCLLGAKEDQTHWATDIILPYEHVVAQNVHGKMVIF